MNQIFFLVLSAKFIKTFHAKDRATFESPLPVLVTGEKDGLAQCWDIKREVEYPACWEHLRRPSQLTNRQRKAAGLSAPLKWKYNA